MLASKKLTWWLALSVTLLALAVITAACAAEEDKPTIKIYDGKWSSMWINNAIAGYIIEYGLEYPIEVVEGGTGTMKPGMSLGDMHVDTEFWHHNFPEWHAEEIAKGQATLAASPEDIGDWVGIVDTGQVFESSAQGWYVPQYVIDDNPGLKSVSDLPDYWEVFKDPEDLSKGIWLNCDIGSNCQMVNRIKATTYGLDEYYNVFEPGTWPTVAATIAGAVTAGDSILTYYYEPTYVVAAYDLVRLEEPPYSPECDAKIQALVHDKTYDEGVAAEDVCGYVSAAIYGGAWVGLEKIAPDVVDFLETYSIGDPMLKKMIAVTEREENPLSYEDMAYHFFETYEDLWAKWVSDDEADSIRAALAVRMPNNALLD